MGCSILLPMQSPSQHTQKNISKPSDDIYDDTNNQFIVNASNTQTIKIHRKIESRPRGVKTSNIKLNTKTSNNVSLLDNNITKSKYRYCQLCEVVYDKNVLTALKILQELNKNN